MDKNCQNMHENMQKNPKYPSKYATKIQFTYLEILHFLVKKFNHQFFIKITTILNA